MSRKYGQRGYQEGERERGEGGARAGGAGGPRPGAAGSRLQPERPRGRGLGAPGEQVFRCAVCGGEQAPPGDLDGACAKCGAALHSCTHCAHFDSAARWECRQSVAERVVKKAARNECALFTARLTLEHGRQEKVDPADPRAAFDALFKL
jgi:hypothetical protein